MTKYEWRLKNSKQRTANYNEVTDTSKILKNEKWKMKNQNRKFKLCNELLYTAESATQQNALHMSYAAEWTTQLNELRSWIRYAAEWATQLSGLHMSYAAGWTTDGLRSWMNYATGWTTQLNELQMSYAAELAA
jgi:hypothetical protein